MMDYKEEQANELEALESIYPDELQILEMEPFPKFQIMVTTQSTDTMEEECSATIIAQFTYTEKYPEEVPLIEITGSESLEEDEVAALTQMMIEMGASIEKMGDMVDEGVKRRAEEKERKLLQEEEAEIARFEGTRVTIETFLAWKTKFDSELDSKKRQVDSNTSKKLTGKELFMKDSTLDDSDVKFIQEEGDSVEVDESLFQDMDDLEMGSDEDLS